jgi:UDP-glucose 4-epimerase
MNILITGGCGFIGSHLVERYMSAGDNVHVIDNLSSGSLNNIRKYMQDPKFQFTEADIVNYEGLENMVEWADTIYHMAAVIGVYLVLAKPLDVYSTNIEGTRRLLDAIIKSDSKPRVIMASSSSVYGHTDNPTLTEDNDLIIKSASHPLSGYAVSKIVGESLGVAYSKVANIPITMIRLFNVIGPRQIGRYGMVVPRFINQALRNEPLTVYGDGEQTRSFCDVRDVVSALCLLETNVDISGGIVNVGNESEISINDLAKLVIRKTASESSIKHVTYADAYQTELTDIKQRRPNLSKLYRLTKFKHQWTLDKSIDNLISLCRDKDLA